MISSISAAFRGIKSFANSPWNGYPPKIGLISIITTFRTLHIQETFILHILKLSSHRKSHPLKQHCTNWIMDNHSHCVRGEKKIVYHLVVKWVRALLVKSFICFYCNSGKAVLMIERRTMRGVFLQKQAWNLLPSRANRFYIWEGLQSGIVKLEWEVLAASTALWRRYIGEESIKLFLRRYTASCPQENTHTRKLLLKWLLGAAPSFGPPTFSEITKDA